MGTRSQRAFADHISAREYDLFGTDHVTFVTFPELRDLLTLSARKYSTRLLYLRERHHADAVRFGAVSSILIRIRAFGNGSRPTNSVHRYPSSAPKNKSRLSGYRKKDEPRRHGQSGRRGVDGRDGKVR